MTYFGNGIKTIIIVIIMMKRAGNIETLGKLADKDATRNSLLSCSIYVTLIPISKIHTSLGDGMRL